MVGICQLPTNCHSHYGLWIGSFAWLLPLIQPVYPWCSGGLPGRVIWKQREWVENRKTGNGDKDDPFQLQVEGPSSGISGAAPSLSLWSVPEPTAPRGSKRIYPRILQNNSEGAGGCKDVIAVCLIHSKSLDFLFIIVSLKDGEILQKCIESYDWKLNTCTDIYLIFIKMRYF